MLSKRALELLALMCGEDSTIQIPMGYKRAGVELEDFALMQLQAEKLKAEIVAKEPDRG